MEGGDSNDSQAPPLPPSTSSNAPVLPFRPVMTALPLPPAGIGGLKPAGLGGIGGIGGIGGLGGLKKSVVSDVSFINRDFATGISAATWKMSIDERMRSIDSFKLYKPIKEECDELNIPDDRVDLAQLNSLMILSYGNVGARYSTEEMNTLIQNTIKINEIYTEITTIYQGIGAPVRKKKLATDKLNIEGLSEEETVLMTFHKVCDKYYEVLAEFQSFSINKKQSKGDNVREPDPEALSNKPLPVWLSTILSKYKTSFHIPNEKKPTVGKLSAFISCCIFNQFDCTIEERSAINELVEASNDQGGSNHSSQRYWAKRIFTFLNKSTELKSYIKDEKSLYNFSPDSFLL